MLPLCAACLSREGAPFPPLPPSLAIGTICGRRKKFLHYALSSDSTSIVSQMMANHKIAAEKLQDRHKRQTHASCR